jgi:hypothetical protein
LPLPNLATPWMIEVHPLGMRGTMKRIFMLLFSAIASIAASADAQTFPGPSSPALARIYFYRLTETDKATPWTRVFINSEKIGALGERSYFFRDVQPGTFKISVSSDVPYQEQYQTVSVAANSTTFVRVFLVPEYGVQVYGGGTGSPPEIYQPSVFGNRVMDRARAQREMVGLVPRGG